MACAVQSMAPQIGQQQSNQPGKNCGVAGLPAAKEPDKPADQVRRVRTPMTEGTCSVVCNFSAGNWLEVLNQSQKNHHLYVRSPTLFWDFCPDRRQDTLLAAVWQSVVIPLSPNELIHLV